MSKLKWWRVLGSGMILSGVVLFAAEGFLVVPSGVAWSGLMLAVLGGFVLSWNPQEELRHDRFAR